MHRLPCSIISVDVQDMMGSHSTGFESNIAKVKLDKNGKDIGIFVKTDDKKQEEELVRNSLKAEEGCNLSGSISVLKVPGNLHISTHSFAHLVSKLTREGVYNGDLSHTVNHLSFGDEKDIDMIKKKFNIGFINPIDGTSKSHSVKKREIDEYYLQVIPSEYIDLNGEVYSCHQFISNSNQVKAQMMVPTVYFRFDISPILVKYTQYRERKFQFFVEICAIIGGIYTVTSVLLSFLINSISLFYRQKEK